MTRMYASAEPALTAREGRYMRVNYGVSEVSEEELLDLWEKHTEMMADAEEAPDEWFREEHRYGYYATNVAIGQWTMDGIINAVIRDKYRQDEMEAITNNMAAVNAVFMQTLASEGIIAATKYLKDSIDEEQTANFQAMQEWRRTAKEVAKEVMTYAKEKGLMTS